MAIVEAPDKNAGRAKAAEQGERVTAFHEAEQHCPAEDPHASLAQYLIEARHILCQPLLCGFEPGAVGERAGPDLDGRPDTGQGPSAARIEAVVSASAKAKLSQAEGLIAGIG